MIISKTEAKKRKLQNSKICEFHQHNPDQQAIMYSCEDCLIIREPCGCDEDSSCEDCEPAHKQKLLTEMFDDIILILIDNGLSPVEADRIFESQKNFRLAIEDIVQKQKAEIFRKFDNLVPEREGKDTMYWEVETLWKEYNKLKKQEGIL